MIGYLDAGTGSMVAGAIAAGAAGVGVVAKSAWMKVSPRRKKKGTQTDEASAENDEGAGDDEVVAEDEPVDQAEA
jgi:hypothetical protein